MKYKINKYVIDAESPTKAVKIAKMLDSKTNDEQYSFKELMNMLVAKHPNKNGYQTDIFKVDGKYSLNPNVHRERFNTLEEIKKHIEMSGNDSVKDTTDFKKALSGWEKDPWTVRNKIQSKLSKSEIDNINVNELGRYLEESYIVVKGSGLEFAKDIMETLKRDSVKDSKYVIFRRHDRSYLGNGARSWVNKESKNIDFYNSKNEALKDLKEYVDDYDAEVIEFKDSIKDDDIEELSEEEKKAIEDYKAAIANTTDPKLLKIFGHILKEEVEHLEELQNEELEDSIKN